VSFKQPFPCLRPAVPLAIALLFAALSPTHSALLAQAAPQQWHAQWIASPDGPERDVNVVYFRKSLSLPAVPAHLRVDVSADTRFELHVNGVRVGAGPALADVHHWRYESFDLAPYLHSGANQIAAIVWNFGTSAAVAQMSNRTAFLLAAEDSHDNAIDTGNGWQSAHEPGRTLSTVHASDYYAAGPPEAMDGRAMLWDWDAPASTAKWAEARPIGHAAVHDVRDSPTPWMLVKDELPPMQYKPVEAGTLVRAQGIDLPAATAFDPSEDQAHPITIPAHSTVTLLLDRKTLTTAFPSLKLSGGRDAAIALTYGEALYDAKGQKGDRNQVEGRHIQGLRDQITADGQTRTYRTLWWRTWRYLQLDITTADTPLTLDSLTAFYTAYPWQQQAHFESDSPELTRIWETGWRTAQLCSHETYMDTPYWEQLQYIGDTRIQSLISYGVTGDDRLARQAILAYRDSVLTEGITQSRYPSNLTQVIPPFSLLWVDMLHDFWIYRDDPAFVAQILPATRSTLDWFTARQRPDSLLGTISWWPFVDWTDAWPAGVPTQNADGGSSALTLQFIEALHNAAELETRFGEPDRAARYRKQAQEASAALMRLNWNPATGLLADTPDKNSYSQQANALAVWLDVIPAAQQRAVMQKVLTAPAATHPPDSNAGPDHPSVIYPTPPPMAPASYYFRFYLARAMEHAGLGDQYIPQLDPWREMLRMGLSTWAEQPEPTRSDSHAWSAHPTLDLLTVVAGISPASPGFETVRIAPHLGPLNSLSASMPSPKGLIIVHYASVNRNWTADVTLPANLTGTFLWQGKTIPLHPGEQHVSVPFPSVLVEKK